MLAREGARVMGSARRTEQLEALKKQITTEGFQLDIFPADAGDSAQMNQLAEETVRKFGRVEIMVYATGTNTPDRAMRRMRTELWDEIMRTNLDGAYYITQAVLPAMREARSGQLIYVSSISGQIADLSGAAYQATKRGLIGLAHAIRAEEKESGIRTTVICPGLVDTEILDKRPVKPTVELLAKALLAEDVAEAILACAKLPQRALVSELTIVPTVL